MTRPARAPELPDLPTDGTLRWSASVRETHGAVVWEHDASAVLPTASVGKLLLLLESARQLTGGLRRPDEVLRRTDDDRVGDSGLWDELLVDALPLADVAVLVAAHSDNTATNVLLREVGLDGVDALRSRLGLVGTRLLDRVRRNRDPAVSPPYPSVGSADELSLLAQRISCGAAVSAEADALVRGWLASGADLSMVASAFGLDPLAHRAADHPRIGGRPALLWNKTGTDVGVRAEVGHLTLGPADADGSPVGRAYAVCAAWDPSALDRTSQVLAAMRAVGAWVRTLT